MASVIPKSPDRDRESPKERLERFISDYEAIDTSSIPAGSTEGDFEEAEDRKRDLQHKINVILQRHPDLGEFAIKKGYPEDNVPLKAQPGYKPEEKDGRGQPEPKGSGEEDRPGDKLKDKDKDKTKGPGAGNNEHDPKRIPKGAKLLSYDGDYYLLYKDKFKGKTITGMYHVPDKMLDHYGLNKKQARPVTKAQFQRFEYLGSVADISLLGKRNPFEPFFEYITDQFGIAPSMLRNKEVVETLFESYMEKWDGSRLFNALQQTKWAKSKTDIRLDWLVNLNDTTRADRVQKGYMGLQEFASQVFGAVDYSKHIDNKQLRQWAEWAQSGRKGWDQDTAELRLKRMAQGIAGTAASLAQEDALENSPLDIESLRAKLRADAQSWAGYGAVPDDKSLTRWATDILNKQKTFEEDWTDYIKKFAQGIHKWLGPEERFLDTASAYKSKLESLYGTTIGWDDPLLSDLTSTKEDGTPVSDQRMSFYDFEQRAVNDDRYKSTESALGEAATASNTLRQLFMGAA